MNKTKIIATVGPVSNSTEKLEQLIKNGVDVFRINLSYATKEFCLDIKEKLDYLNQKLNTNIALMFDTCGPEVRVGRIHEKEAELITDTKIRIYTDDVLGDQTKFSLDYKRLIKDVNYDTIIKLSNGKVELQVLDKGNDYLLCLVIKGGIVRENSIANILGVDLDLPFISEKDKDFIKFADELNIDFLCLSAVESHEHILEANDLLIDLGNNHMSIIAKVQNEQAITNIDEIINASDGVLISRGDLGIEVPMERIPGIQKTIVSKCQDKGKISIVATEMMASMENNLVPTRAEVSDVAYAVLDGTDAVMLSGETTIGKYPVETVIAMEKILESAEHDIEYTEFIDKALKTENKDITGLIAHSVTDAALYLKCKAIFAPTMSGYTARKISRFRPYCPIIAASPDIETVKSLQLYLGVYPILINEPKTIDRVMELSKKHIKDKIDINPKDKYIITGGYPFKEVKYTNFMKIEEM